MKFQHIKLAAIASCIAMATASHAALNAYLQFRTQDGKTIPGESQVQINGSADWIQVASFSFDTEQTLNIGSQSSGAGAGKVTFNPFSFRLKSSSLDPQFFKMLCSGQSFKTVTLVVQQANGAAAKPTIVETFTMGLVAFKKMVWSGEEDVTLNCEMAYGQLQIAFPGGKNPAVGGWDRVKNTTWTATTDKALMAPAP